MIFHLSVEKAQSGKNLWHSHPSTINEEYKVNRGWVMLIRFEFHKILGAEKGIS